MKNIIKKYTGMLLCATLLVACHKDLDRFPPNTVIAGELLTNEQGYKQFLAKVYGSMALTGNQGPAGSGDVAGIDEGTSDFLRLFWVAQELTTDEAVVSWNDPGLPDFHRMNWSANNSMLNGLYNRCFYIITLTNQFIKESTPEMASARGVNPQILAQMQAEARFVRAYQYWVLMDLFGSPGFVDETTSIGTTNLPQQITRANLFKWIESELKAIEGSLPAPRAAEYGRADQGAVWSLLARLYLNAQVYTGTASYNNAITYAKKVIDAGYQLLPNYENLYRADNNVNNTEAILTLNYDGINTRNYGGTTFLINGATSGESPEQKEINGLGGWSGMRITKNVPQLFPGYPGFNTRADSRALFFTQGQSPEINDISKFSDGYAVTKFRNKTRSGAFGKDPERVFSDVDFMLFRLAEMHLIYAEATLRGGSGDAALALTYFNRLRQRAYGNTSGNVQSISLDLILEERARELYWEAFRRTDLIRYGRFTDGNYLWPFKGGVASGTGVPSFRRIFPIPATEVSANPNIKQNPGY